MRNGKYGNEIMYRLFNNIFTGRKVLITGHTGFKGSWLGLWLTKLGASVSGFSLAPDSDPNHFDLLGLPIETQLADICHPDAIAAFIKKVNPEVVFHLAAQPLVRYSYQQPILTYQTNVMGTAHVLEACKNTPSVRAIVCITTDKVYENQEWWWGYRENDRLGGIDPYSSSKACAELVIQSYRESYFSLDNFQKTHSVLLASVRAGNIIGGGDWAADRLMPDLMKAAAAERPCIIRNPNAIRPWQHVLESLSGYLLIAQRLLEKDTCVATGWNLGPMPADTASVRDILTLAQRHWKKINYCMETQANAPHEAGRLTLDISRSQQLLHWQPVWRLDQAIAQTVNWYRSYYEHGAVISAEQLDAYVLAATEKKLIWTANN
jgi:CDP-glucose 4,6-dehydratase